MNESRVDVTQLMRRDPKAWTALLSSQPGLEDVVVTAITSQAVQRKLVLGDHTPRVTRYILVLADHSDSITLIGKETTAREAAFYRDIAENLPFIAPHCYFTHILDDRGWVILDDVPNDFPPGRWSVQDVEDVIDDIAAFHAVYWDQPSVKDQYPWLTHFIDRQQKTYNLSQLRQELGSYFEEGPSAMISDHALRHLGRLAPKFLEAANGVAVMRALGGWPGVLGESHLSAASDLLDDPVPLLEPLTRLSQTLLHGNMHSYHWHITLFDERRLVDWDNVTLGPGIFDLISFQERFELLISGDEIRPVYAREEPPIDEETIIDSYMLAMKAELGVEFDARAMRQAIPAARCLFVLENWFPYFASRFDDLPDFFTWQRINRMSSSELEKRTVDQVYVYRPYLKRVFRRFLQAYHML
ncbi:MAG: hypothetical protein ACK2T4_13030 [Candidatus Promineifilaceae bacterium]|jgi:hypothetical protein